MALPNIFTKEVTDQIVERIQKLSPETQALWGTMNVSQMLTHCCVTYDYIYTDKFKKPSGFKKLIIKMLVKPIVTNEKTYKKNSPTAPDFKIVNTEDFESEKKRLLDYLIRTQELGEKHFDGLESHSFGKLNKTEWNNMLYKHIDHHLNQFGV